MSHVLGFPLAALQVALQFYLRSVIGMYSVLRAPAYPGNDILTTPYYHLLQLTNQTELPSIDVFFVIFSEYGV